MNGVSDPITLSDLIGLLELLVTVAGGAFSLGYVLGRQERRSRR